VELIEETLQNEGMHYADVQFIYFFVFVIYKQELFILCIIKNIKLKI